MKFSSGFLDTLKSRLPVSEVVRRYVQLRKAGKEYSGLCPFHNEKTPSFTVNDAKEFYHCFGCGAHGSIFDFIMEKEGASFPEAVERLAAQAGIPVPLATPEEIARAEHRQSQFEILDKVAGYYASLLFSQEGNDVRTYLKSRGVDRTTAREFRLGFAPDARQGLEAQFKAWDIPPHDWKETGLLAEGDEGTYDRFRGRLMFPIEDIRGRVIAFGGRILKSETKAAKYLNSPETGLFHKGRMLYNLKRARTAKEPFILVVEGYMDVIALYQQGVKNVVAPLGTALTADQIQLLWQATDRLIVCFDGDSAGERAAARTIETALPILQAGKEIAFLHLPPGEDPDSFIRKQGLKAWKELEASAVPLHAKMVDVERKRRPLNTPEAKLDFYKRLKAATRQITDPTLQKLYYQSLKDLAYPFIYGPGRHKQVAPAAFAAGTATRHKIKGTERNQQALLAALYFHPALMEDTWEILGGLVLTPALQACQQKFLDHYLQEEPLELTADEEKLMKDPALLKLYSAIRPETGDTLTLSWWLETAEALTNWQKSLYERGSQPEINEENLENWWPDYSKKLNHSSPPG